MRALTTVLLACLLVLAVTPAALAEIKGPNNETCNSSESNVKHDIKGKSYTCDKCVILSCSTGGEVSNCTSTTHWSNCVAAFVSPGGAGQLQTETGQSLAPVAEPPKSGIIAPLAPPSRK